MSAGAGTSHKQYKIGVCPGCRCGVWAEVDLATDIREPYLTSDGKAAASVTAKITGVAIEHTCAGVNDS